MTREEAAKIIEKQFDESCGDYRYQNKDKLDYEDALWLAIAALRQREEFMPPCYKPDSGDGECAYQIYGPDDDEPIERCKACPLCYSDKMRHNAPKHHAIYVYTIHHRAGTGSHAQCVRPVLYQSHRRRTYEQCNSYGSWVYFTCNRWIYGRLPGWEKTH